MQHVHHPHNLCKQQTAHAGRCTCGRTPACPPCRPRQRPHAERWRLPAGPATDKPGALPSLLPRLTISALRLPRLLSPSVGPALLFPGPASIARKHTPVPGGPALTAAPGQLGPEAEVGEHRLACPPAARQRTGLPLIPSLPLPAILSTLHLQCLYAPLHASAPACQRPARNGRAGPPASHCAPASMHLPHACMDARRQHDVTSCFLQVRHGHPEAQGRPSPTPRTHRLFAPVCAPSTLATVGSWPARACADAGGATCGREGLAPPRVFLPPGSRCAAATLPAFARRVHHAHRS